MCSKLWYGVIFTHWLGIPNPAWILPIVSHCRVDVKSTKLHHPQAFGRVRPYSIQLSLAEVWKDMSVLRLVASDCPAKRAVILIGASISQRIFIQNFQACMRECYFIIYEMTDGLLNHIKQYIVNEMSEFRSPIPIWLLAGPLRFWCTCDMNFVVYNVWFQDT